MAETKLQDAHGTSDVIVGFNWFGDATGDGCIREYDGTSGRTPLGPKTDGSAIDNLTSDPIAFYFVISGGALRVLLVQRQFVGGVQAPAFLTVYNPVDWKATVPQATYNYIDGSPVTNIYTAPSTLPVGNTTNLFVADYVSISGGVRTNGRIAGLVHQLLPDGESLAADIHTPYQFIPTAPNATMYSVGTVVDPATNYIYAAAQQYDANFTHFPSQLVRLRVEPDFSIVDDYVPVAIAPNVFDIQLYGDRYLFLTCLGGAQNPGVWNEASRIQRVPISNLAQVENVFRPSTVVEASEEDSFDIRSLVFIGTHAFILTGPYDENFAAISGRLWQVDETFLISAQLPDPLNGTLISATGASPVETIEEVSGFFWALAPAEYVSKVWGIFGNTLALYSGGGVSGTPLTTTTAAPGWHTPPDPLSPVGFNSMNVVLRPSSGQPIKVHHARGYVQPVFAKGNPDEIAAFIKSCSPKK
jgi:hypothetical protein